MTIIIVKDKTLAEIGLIPLSIKLEKKGLKSQQWRLNKEQYIREQLKDNPSNEEWDYLEYFSYKTYICLCTTATLISTKGRVAYEIDGNVHISTGTVSGKYLQAHVKPGFDKDYVNIYIHRGVACTFLAIPEKYKEMSLHKLEVNHLNGVKTQPHFANLEWGTKSDNLKHAVKMGLIKVGKDNIKVKPVLGTVIVDSKWKGTQFVLYGRTAISNLGLDPASIQQTVSGKAKATYGCSWEYISQEEADKYPKAIPAELLERMNNDKVSLLLTTKPLLATLEKDGVEYQCVFMGTKEVLDAGFQQAHISRVCSGVLKTHGDMKWKYIPLIEAERLHRGLTPEMKEMLNK